MGEVQAGSTVGAGRGRIAGAGRVRWGAGRGRALRGQRRGGAAGAGRGGGAGRARIAGRGPADAVGARGGGAPRGQRGAAWERAVGVGRAGGSPEDAARRLLPRVQRKRKYRRRERAAATGARRGCGRSAPGSGRRERGRRRPRARQDARTARRGTDPGPPAARPRAHRRPRLPRAAPSAWHKLSPGTEHTVSGSPCARPLAGWPRAVGGRLRDWGGGGCSGAGTPAGGDSPRAGRLPAGCGGLGVLLGRAGAPSSSSPGLGLMGPAGRLRGTRRSWANFSENERKKSVPGARGEAPQSGLWGVMARRPRGRRGEEAEGRLRG